MKKFGFATVIAGGLVGAFLGLGAPAQAVASPAGLSTVSSAIEIPTGVDHRDWLDHFGPNSPGGPSSDNTLHPSH